MSQTPAESRLSAAVGPPFNEACIKIATVQAMLRPRIAPFLPRPGFLRSTTGEPLDLWACQRDSFRVTRQHVPGLEVGAHQSGATVLRSEQVVADLVGERPTKERAV